MQYANIIYALVIVYLFIKVKRSELNLFGVFVFLIPFQSWLYNIGLTLYAYQFAVLFMLFNALVTKKDGLLKILRFNNRPLIAFLTYVTFITIIISNVYIDSFMNAGGYFRSEGRYIAQLLLYFVMFSVVPLGFIYLKSLQDIFGIIKVYLKSLIFLAILGWLQLALFYLIGLDIFPIGIGEDNNAISGVWDGVYRISSLGGDPKAFSLSLILGVFIIHIFNDKKITFFKWDIIVKYFLLITAFATFSTSGMVLFIILVLFLFVNVFFVPNKLVQGGVKRRIFTFLLVIGFSVAIIGNLDFIGKVIDERILKREITQEDFDAPILTFLSKFPEYLFFGSGLGNIHNYAFPYIKSEHLYYMKGNIFVAKSGYLRIISELGLVGFSLLLIVINSIYQKLRRLKKSYNENLKSIISGMQLLLIVALISYFARSYLFAEFILVLSLTNVLCNSKTFLIYNSSEQNSLYAVE